MKKIFFLMNLFLLLLLVLSHGTVADAAQVGIKYNRAKWEYPRAVLKDFKKFHEDRITTVMICLPWAQWEPFEGELDAAFILNGLAPVLEFCEKNNLSVILSNHCSYWAAKGNWSLPPWLLQKPGFQSATSALTSAPIRAYQISFLKRWIDITHRYAGIVGYNILNEPVAATKVYVKDKRSEFDARWEGTVEIASQVRAHMDQTQVPQFLIIGNGYSETGYVKTNWDNTGKIDLRNLWTDVLSPVAGQDIRALIALSAMWCADRPKIQTESSLNYALLKALRACRYDFSKLHNPLSHTKDYSVVVYDYDSIYDFEGGANAAVKKLEAFYVWRIGSPDGSYEKLDLFDHRRHDRPTPYYWALRDLASGIDSFEALDETALPQSSRESILFDPTVAKPGISKRWSGSGTITGQKVNLPPQTDSTIAARMILEKDQSVFRSVISAHWKDNGVTSADSLVFFANAEAGGEVVLVVQAGSGTWKRPVKITAGEWNLYKVSFRDLGLKDADISFIKAVGFTNESREKQDILIDEFLIR